MAPLLMSRPTLSALYEHPLKSCRGNAVPRAEVEFEGLSRDRRFLAHTADGTFISGRSHPSLVLVRADWDGSILRLAAPGRTDLIVRPQAVVSASVAVWASRFPAWDQGDEAADWLSECVGEAVRLAWLGASQRPLLWDEERRVTFADAAPCTALGDGSLRELSRRVGEPLSERRFRPNLFLAGLEAFEEDGWRRFRIGEVEFQVLDGCGRCEFTTVDPDTAERHPRREPVATLETFRRTDTGVYFALNLMPLNRGTLRVGDPVTVLETRRPLFFGPVRPVEAALAALPVGERWPEGAALLRCTAVREEVPGVKTFTFVRADGRRFAWDAGQYLTLRLESPEGPLYRSYTIASAPGGDPQLTVKRLEDGRASAWLHDHGRLGFTVLAEAVGGSFTLRAHPWDSLLFLGAGSGVTPLMAMLRWIASADLPVDVAFHQSARTRAEVLFGDELEALQAQLGPRLTVATRVTAEQGRLDRQSLVTFCPDLRERRAFVSGPAGYRAAVRGLLSASGLKLDRRYHEELFGEEALEAPTDAEPGTVRFLRTEKSVASDGRTTVLQLAERLGIDLPSSCRSGDCGTCRVRLATGEWVLACRSFPRGDVSVDL